MCTGSVEETKALCRRLLDEVFLPNIAKRRELFEEMGRILIVGLWPMNPHLDPDAFSAFTFKMALRAARNNNHSIEIGKKKSRFNLQKVVFNQFLSFRFLQILVLQSVRVQSAKVRTS